MAKKLIDEAFEAGGDPDKIQGFLRREDEEGLEQYVAFLKVPPATEIPINLPGVGGDILDQVRAYVQSEILKMSQALDRLKAEVAETKSVNESVRTLIGGMAEQIRTLAANGGASDAELNQMADELDAEQAKMAQAVQANTVADPGAPPPDNSIDAAPNSEPSVPPVADIVEPAPVPAQDPPANV